MAKLRKGITTDMRPRDDSWDVLKNVKNPTPKLSLLTQSPQKTFWGAQCGNPLPLIKAYFKTTEGDHHGHSSS